MGGTASGLSGTGLILRVDGGDDLAVTGSGEFTFATRVASGASYSVAIQAQPSNPTQTCALSNASGTVGSANVTNISLTCTTNAYTVGGTVSGVSVDAGLVLRNGSEELAISRNGRFVFAAGILSGAVYNVSVQAQPTAPVQACVVTNGAGTIASAGVADVVVICDGIALYAGAIGGPGSTDGVGRAARFNSPYDVAFDAAGNMYVADGGNDVIRKITPAREVSVFAGSVGRSDSTDGNGAAARFFSPRGVATDAAGNVYVADYNNHTIRKITPAGMVSTFAGTAGAGGFVNATGNAARFSFPHDIVSDPSGNLYVADSNNHMIRKITLAGVVTTLAGATQSGSADGAAAARFNAPRGLATDAAGNVYVADSSNHTIRKITPAGLVSTIAGTVGQTGFADGSPGSFNRPSRLAVDSSGNVLVADTNNETIRKITPAGVVSTFAGLARNGGSADGAGNAARFDAPYGIATDSAGDIYVSESSNHTIRKITAAGLVSTVAGAAVQTGSNDGDATSARFYFTGGVAADSAGNVYLADYGNSTIRKITASGVVSTLAGMAGLAASVDGAGSEARFYGPTDLATDAAGNVYVTEFTNTVRKITPAGVVTTLAGLAGEPGSNDGVGSGARFDSLYGTATDPSGNVFVSDRNHTIRKITPDGVVSTFAGAAFQSGSTDATGTAARFADPGGLATDSAGNVYVADSTNNTIRKITPAGVVSTLAGAPLSIGFVDDVGSAARFYSPNDVAVDAAGNVYVADYSNNAIRRIAPDGMVTTVAGAVRAAGVRLGPLPGSLSGPKFITLLPGPRTTLVETNEEGAVLLITLP